MKIQKAFAFTLTIIFCLAFCFAASGQTEPKTSETKKESQKKAGNSITFKIPDNVMPMKWADFKGMLMLDPKRPMGIFIAYPDENEPLDKLKERAGKAIAKMFLHDDKKVEAVVWQTKTVPVHQGDKENSAVMKIYDDEKQTIQITAYERQSGDSTAVYGYFARKSKTSKDKDDNGDFLDDQGKGSKRFDQFWKSFPNK